MQTIKLVKAGIFTLLVAVGLLACEGSLTDYNENPNAPENAPAQIILPNTITSSMNRLYSMSGLNGYVGSIWVQHFAKIQYVDEDRYDFSGRATLVDNIWDSFYAGTLTDLQRIKDQAAEGTGDEARDANAMAIANILMAWNWQTVTDLWGPVPVSEALQGDNPEEPIISPAYESQDEVYTLIIQMLDDATASIVESNTPFGSEDLIYNGDMSQWLKLANSLKLRAYMRLSDVDPDRAAAGIAEVVSDGNYFESNADNAQMMYQAYPNNNPVNEFLRTREDHKVSVTILDYLKDLDDPRIHFYAVPIESDSVWNNSELQNEYPQGRYPDSVYVGVVNGDENNSLPLSDASNIGHYFIAPNSPGFIMTYSEVEFILAEAALEGWIESPSDAATHYENGIRASMEMYNQANMNAVLEGFTDDLVYAQQDIHSQEFPSGMTEEEIDDYLSGPAAWPAAGSTEEQENAIALQKWIALYGQGLQAWFEWRRLDYPPLEPGPTAVIDEVPKRLFYPPNEQSVNNENYQEAVQMLDGPDNLTTRVWWDVNEPSN